MKYAQIRDFDISNGPGIRATLFVAGCTHNCKGCFNKEYQDFNYGTEWNPRVEQEFLDMIKNDRIDGVNILGGEPLQQTMDNNLASLLSRIKLETNKPIWLWTGYLLEDAINYSKVVSILENVDVLIDGKFQEDKKDLGLFYRGSSNQRVIDFKKSVKSGNIVEYV